MTIAIRIPLPDHGVQAKVETQNHLWDGGSCLIFVYNLAAQQALVSTLEEAVAAVKRGPVEGRTY